MASTNKTTNYNLSQFIGTDKPAWLADYNQDMSKIDAGVHTAQTTATGADGKADANATKIGTLANLTTDAKTSAVAAINEVDSHADTAQNTATSANNLAGQAKNKADDLATYLTLTGKQNITVTTSQGVIGSTTNIASAYNTDGSLGKVYGAISVGFSGTPSGSVTVTIADTSLRPTTDINILGVIMNVYTAQGFSFSGVTPMVVHTDGRVTISVNPTSITTSYQLILPPCLYFMNNFGD